MSERVLVTGGAGFVGSFLVDELIARGHSVRIFDSLAAQVHGVGRRKPGHLNPEADFIGGDVRDREALKKAIQGVDVIVHSRGKSRSRPVDVRDPRVRRGEYLGWRKPT